MYIFYLVWTVIGIAAFVGIGAIGFWVLPRFARHEARETTKSLVIALLFVYGIGAILIQPILRSRASEQSRALLESYCDWSGEEIYRTVNGVDGIEVLGPGSDERLSSSWIDPPDKTYSFVEVTRPGSEDKVLRYSYRQGRIQSELDVAPTARYGVTWMALTRIGEGNNGIGGVQMLVYDKQTNEVLATRTDYSFYDRRNRNRGRAALHTCEGSYVGTAYAGRLGPANDSYDWVSRILVPAPFQEAEPIVDPAERDRAVVRRTRSEIAEIVGGEEVGSAQRAPDRFDAIVEAAARRSQLPSSPNAESISRIIERLPENIRLHMVRTIRPGSPRVRVSLQGQPVLLVLWPNADVEWTVSVDRGAQLVGVFLAGDARQIVQDLPPGVPVYSTAASGGMDGNDVLRLATTVSGRPVSDVNVDASGPQTNEVVIR